MTNTSNTPEIKPTAIDEVFPAPKDSTSITKLNVLGAIGETVLIRSDGKTYAGVVTEWFHGPGYPRRMYISVATFKARQLNYYSVSFCLDEAEAKNYMKHMHAIESMKGFPDRHWDKGTFVAWPTPRSIGLYNTNQEVWKIRR